MKCLLKVTIRLDSDFHTGTGTGRGRTIDAGVMKDESGCPYILGSSLKGLARYHAHRTVMPAFDGDFQSMLFEKVFGAEGKERGWFLFDDAYLPESRRSAHPIVVGRSARDRQSGTTRDKSLFFNEVAAGTTFQASVTADGLPDDAEGGKAVLLVMMALRRIEALGASRRRGLGRCSVTVVVEEGPSCLRGCGLPEEAGDPAAPATAGEAPTPWLKSIWEKVGSEQAAAGSVKPLTVPPQPDETPACLPLIAQAVSPLVFTADQGADNIISSLDHVPGSTLRGAVAHWLIRNGTPANSDLFQQWIVREGLHFGPLYPLDDAWRHQQTMPVPVPASFAQCKQHPGELRYPPPLPATHGVVDRLYHRKTIECGCGEPLAPCSGWANLLQPNDQEPRYELRTWKSRWRTVQRTAIDRTTNRAVPKKLFATESIPAGTWFAGYVWGRKWAIDLLASGVFNTERTFRVGRSRTRGHGELCVWPGSPAVEGADGREPSDPTYPMIYAGGALPSAPPGDGFCLTCYTDLVAVDPFLRPLTQLTETDFCRLLSLRVAKGTRAPFRIVSAFVRSVRVSGFNGVPQLPRMADVAVAAGSTWRFEWLAGDTAVRNAAWDALLRAHRQGIGLRRGEGYGRVMLNPPLQAARLNQVQQAAASRKTGPPPEHGCPSPVSDSATAGEGASFQVGAGASWCPRPTAASRIRRGGLAPGWRASDRKAAAEIAGKCESRLRAAAARLLWQIRQSADPAEQLSRQIEQLRDSRPPYPLPGGKHELTGQALAAFLYKVKQKYDKDPDLKDPDLAGRLQLVAESLQTLVDSKPKENV